MAYTIEIIWHAATIDNEHLFMSDIHKIAHQRRSHNETINPKMQSAGEDERQKW